MKRVVRISAAIILWLSAPHFGGTQETLAAPIYSQVLPAQPIGAFTSTDRLGYPKVADNFLLNIAQPTTIRSIRLIGGYTATMPPPITPPLDSLPTDNVRVIFMNDAIGTPGAPLPGGDFSIGSAVRRTPTNGILLNGNQFPIEYALDLASGITLSPNTIYWVSILNDPGPQYGWQWARAAGATDQKLADTEGEVLTGPWNVFSNGGMFFALDDANVPEPGANVIATVTAAFLLRYPLIRFRSHGSRSASFVTRADS